MLRFDDQFPLHRKVAALSEPAFRVHVETIFWSRRNLTDGFVPTEDLTTCTRVARPDRAAAELVRRVCWHRVEDGRIAPDCAECKERHPDLFGDGWVIHGFEDWQETKAQVRTKSEAKAKAGRAGGIKSGQSRRSKPPDGRSKREAGTKQRASHSLPNERTPEPPRPPTGGSGGRARGAAPPPAADAPRCPHHPFSPLPCGPCRSEQIGAA